MSARWIPLGERLPELGSRVLVLLPEEGYPERNRIVEAEFRIFPEAGPDHPMWNLIGEFHTTRKVTHWQPLPPPP